MLMIFRRDVLDHRYFDKRRLFLAGLWKTLELCDKKREQKLYSSIHSSLLKHDSRKPILEVVPRFCEHFTVRVIPIVSLLSLLVFFSDYSFYSLPMEALR